MVTLPERRISDEEERRRRKIHESSKSQAEAAKRAGISQQAWSRWTTRRGLSAPGTRRPPVPDRELKRRLRILKASRTLKDAAERIGVSAPALYVLMEKKGVNPPAEQRARRNDEWIELIKAGHSDASIAREYAVEKTAVRYVRLKAGLPAVKRGRPRKHQGK